MKKLLIILAVVALVGCAKNSSVTENRDSNFETLKAEMATKGVDIVEAKLPEGLLEQAQALIAAQDKAGGVEKFQQATMENDKLIELFLENRSVDNLYAVLEFMRINKIPLITTAGLVYDPQRVCEILLSAN